MKLPKVGDFVISEMVSLALYKCIKSEANSLKFLKVKEVPEGNYHVKRWSPSNSNFKALVKNKVILLEHEEIEKHIQKEQLDEEAKELFE